MAERTYTLTEGDLRSMKDGDAFDVYIIKRGDTLHELAKKFGTSVDTLARINGVKDPSRIDAGDKLLVPVRR